MSEEAARYIHSELMDEHGGLFGPSHEGALEAALARPQNKSCYSQILPTLAELAAAYGYGIARGHCFPDGNKRLSLAVIDVFLQLNEHELTAAEALAVVTIRAVAAGEMTEDELAEWIQENSAPLST